MRGNELLEINLYDHRPSSLRPASGLTTSLAMGYFAKPSDLLLFIAYIPLGEQVVWKDKPLGAQLVYENIPFGARVVYENIPFGTQVVYDNPKWCRNRPLHLTKIRNYVYCTFIQQLIDKAINCFDWTSMTKWDSAKNKENVLPHVLQCSKMFLICDYLKPVTW